jgi:hypothetical protein
MDVFKILLIVVLAVSGTLGTLGYSTAAGIALIVGIVLLRLYDKIIFKNEKTNKHVQPTI